MKLKSIPIKFCKRIFLFVVACLSLNSLYAGSLCDESNFWPPKIELTHELKLYNSEKALPVGRHGVLIRIEQDENDQELLVVDFGSNGVHKLSPDQTNVFELVQKYKNGEAFKSFPNWTMMIGRAFIYVDNSSVRPIKLKEISGYNYMLFIYNDTLDSKEMHQLLRTISASSEALEDAKVMVIVLPASNLSGRVSNQEVQEICKQHDLKLYYVYPYLSTAYISSLHHEVSKYPSCVLTDVEGKTVWTSKCKEAISFEEILQQLH